MHTVSLGRAFSPVSRRAAEARGLRECPGHPSPPRVAYRKASDEEAELAASPLR